MKTEGLLFDFNGTLFYDSDFHDEAFEVFAQKYLHRSLYAGENLHEIHGHVNREIMRHFFGPQLSDEEADKYGLIKEEIYRDICARHPERVHLAFGAEALFDLCAEKKIPVAIASSCDCINRDFYFQTFHLERWFTLETFVNFDPAFAPKPAPDLYLEAASRISAKPKNCIAFEDSKTGLHSAYNAGIGRIYQIEASKDFHEDSPAFVRAVLTSFSDFDTNEL